MNPTLADISVIIPAYNRAGLIGETLRCLLNQTVQAKEIIVVDDGSTDDTARVVERIAEEIEVRRSEIDDKQRAGSREQGALDAGYSTLDSPQIRVIRQANAGPGAARNRGLAEATGEFIHFFDSDDIAAPNKQEVQLRALLETGADIACGPWVKGRFAPEEARSVARPLAHGVARGSLPLAAQTARVVAATEAIELRVASFNSGNTRYQLPATLYSGFTPEGPVLQAQGLPQGDLIKALLTNWSIVPHACLFRRSILEKAGGFPEDIWVGEDQLLFLRCLLAGAKVVHTPGTMVYYRVGNDPGKLTATGAAQKRHARDWARFLLKANQEVAAKVKKLKDELTTEDTTENRGRCEMEQPKVGPKGERVGTIESKNTEGTQGDAQRTCACSSKSDSLLSELADSPVSELLTRSASGPASSPATSYSLPVTTPPAEWYGFRLRAYEAWRDLEKFFPEGEGELKNELQAIWKRNHFSGFIFQVSGFLMRKLGGLKQRVWGHRWPSSFCSEMATKTSLEAMMK